MRYIIFAFPLYPGTPITTDFKLIAYGIAFFKRLIYSEVYVIDNDTGEYIFFYCRDKQQHAREYFFLIREMADLFVRKFKA
jgi:hypothetical protein